MPPRIDSPRGAVAAEATVQRLLIQADAIGALAAGSDDELRLLAAGVSRWTVGQQLEHMGLVGTWVVDAVGGLCASPDEPPAGRPSLPGWVHLLTGWIPRGRVRARPAVTPQTAEPAAARAEIERYLSGLASLPELAGALPTARATRAHPALGHLTAQRWLLFLFRHQRHHLGIIGEIQRAA